VQNYLIQNRLVEEIYRQDYPKPEIEKASVRKTILKASPDILGLQEIGDERFLSELQNDLEEEGLTYPFRYWMEADDRLRHLAVLSKIEAKEVIEHRELHFDYFGKRVPVKRGVLELVFQGENEVRVHLFILHLKSRFTDLAEDPRSALRRVGEATVIRDLIRDRMDTYPERGMLVLGDFNDSINSRPLARFLEVGGERLLGLVEMSDSRGEVWTHFYRAEETYSRVDFVLVNESLKKRIAGMDRMIEDIVRPHGSDHRLIWLDIPMGE